MTGYYVLKRYPDGSIRKPDVVYLDRLTRSETVVPTEGSASVRFGLSRWTCSVRIGLTRMSI